MSLAISAIVGGGAALLGAGAATAIALGVGAGVVVNQTQQAKKAAKAQESAAQQATEAAKQQATQADRAFNRANQKQPNVGAMLEGNRQAAMGGAGATMLTGPSGIDPNALQLGKNTLLGG